MITFFKFVSLLLYSMTMFVPGQTKIQIKVLKGAIFNFLPNYFKEHHIVIVSTDKPSSFLYSPRVYTLDYSPINQSHPKTWLKLAIGNDVPGEVRIREIPTVTINEEDKIFEEWIRLINSTMFSYEKSQQMSDFVISDIKSEKLKSFFNKILEWKTPMNLYTHNCQHFSRFVQDL